MKNARLFLVLFACLFGMYFTFLFIFYSAWSSNIPVEMMIIIRHEMFYTLVLYAGIGLLPLFVMVPLRYRKKKTISTLQSALLVCTPVLAGWCIAQLVLPLLVETAPWESLPDF